MNQQSASEFGIQLTDFDRALVVMKEPGKQTTLSSVEMGQQGDCLVDVRDASGATIGFAFTKGGKRYVGSQIKGDGFFISLGDSTKIVAIDAMGSVKQPEKGPEVMTKAMTECAGQEKTLIGDLYTAEQALIAYGTNGGKVSKNSDENKIPYSTVAGCRVVQTREQRRLEVAQVGNAILYIVPLKAGQPLVTRNQTAAGRDFHSHWLTRDEMLLSIKNKQTLSALGRRELEDPQGKRADYNREVQNQAVFTDALKYPQQRHTDPDFPNYEEGVVVLVASDAIDFMPSHIVVGLMRDTFVHGGSAKDVVKAIVSQSEANKGKLMTPDWLREQIQTFLDQPRMSYSEARKSKDHIMWESSPQGRFYGKATETINKAKQFIVSQQQLLDLFGITYKREVISELSELASDDPAEACWAIEQKVEAILEGKYIGLGEIAYGKAVTGDVLPLKSDEIADAVRFFFNDKNYYKLAEKWSHEIEYISLLGKAFVRKMKPRMMEMGIYGEPDLVFLAHTALKMIEKTPEGKREQFIRSELLSDKKTYLEQVYRDWVSANIISDDVTLVAFKV